VTSSTATTSASGITTALLSAIAGSSASSGSFVSELNQLGTDLSNGDLSNAQGDLLSLDSTALNAAPASSAAASSATTSASNQADIAALIKATIQAMEAGDDSSIGTDLSQLASLSPSSDGASYLASASQSYGSGSSSSSPISQLLDSLNTSTSPSSSLSLLA
jgi:hypothetical protein